jgi:hypothetical protein
MSVNADGLVDRTVVFDHDAIDAAFTELDERYLRGEGRPHAEVWQPTAAFLDAYATRDWSTLEQTLAPGFQVVDHRQIGWPLRGRADYLATLQALAEQAREDRMWRTAMVRLSGGLGLAMIWHRGLDTHGGPFERHFAVLSVVSSGLIIRLEIWEAEDLHRAVERFHELDRLATAAPYVNRAMAVGVEVSRRLGSADPEHIAELFAPDGVMEDRQFVHSTLRGRDELRRLAEAMSAIDDVQPTVLATRGERLVLSHTRASGSNRGGRFEVDYLALVEIDENDLVARNISFDPRDLDAAVAELDRRFTAGAAAKAPAPWPEIQEVVDAYNAGHP